MNGPMIPCDEVMKRLWTFLDGELEHASAEEVRAHLARCQRCFPHYDFQRAYFRLMGRLSDSPVEAGVRGRVFAALLEETANGGADSGAPG